jgi:signal transduction histidine kinase
MLGLPDRAPIAYDEMRRPLSRLRVAGSCVFIVAAVLAYLRTDDATTLLIIIPAAAVLIDGIFRMATARSALPGLLIDATALFVAIALRGPSLTTTAVAVSFILVASSLLLPMIQAVGVVAYACLLWVATDLLADIFTTGPIGSIERDGLQVGFDRIMVFVVLVAIAAVMLRAIRALLNAQDQQAEALAQERRAVQLKNEFVSMVSHELRTPLTGIAGFTDTLSDNWESLPSREVGEFLGIMRQETDHLANLVEDILVIPRLEAGQLRLDPTALDLAVQTRAVANMIFAEDSDYAVTIPSNVIVLADATRLRQILRNLLENALKYGGEQVLIEGELSGPGLYTVSVSDNGRGVPPSEQQRIFEHFEQLSTGDARLQQGVGLGLPIARKLARAMGGELWYEDLFPVGSKFRFTVNLSSAANTEHAQAGARVSPEK